MVDSLTVSRCGKTTLARLLAKRTNAVFKELSATDSGISDVRSVSDEAKGVLALTGRYERLRERCASNLHEFD